MLLEARVSLVYAAARAPGCGVGYDGGGPRRAGTLTPPTPAGGFVYVRLRVRGGWDWVSCCFPSAGALLRTVTARRGLLRACAWGGWGGCINYWQDHCESL
jgi:hypothetical protein